MKKQELIEKIVEKYIKVHEPSVDQIINLKCIYAKRTMKELNNVWKKVKDK